MAHGGRGPWLGLGARRGLLLLLLGVRAVSGHGRLGRRVGVCSRGIHGRGCRRELATRGWRERRELAEEQAAGRWREAGEGKGKGWRDEEGGGEERRRARETCGGGMREATSTINRDFGVTNKRAPRISTRAPAHTRRPSSSSTTPPSLHPRPRPPPPPSILSSSPPSPPVPAIGHCPPLQRAPTSPPRLPWQHATRPPLRCKPPSVLPCRSTHSIEPALLPPRPSPAHLRHPSHSAPVFLRARARPLLHPRTNTSGAAPPVSSATPDARLLSPHSAVSSHSVASFPPSTRSGCPS